MHLVCNGKPVRTVNTRRGITDNPSQWRMPDGRDGMIYGDAASTMVSAGLSGVIGRLNMQKAIRSKGASGVMVKR